MTEHKDEGRRRMIDVARKFTMKIDIADFGSVGDAKLGDIWKLLTAFGERLAAAPVSGEAGYVSELRPNDPPPSCHACGAIMKWKCLSCGTTTGVSPAGTGQPDAGFCDKHKPSPARQYAGCWVCSREEETQSLVELKDAYKRTRLFSAKLRNALKAIVDSANNGNEPGQTWDSVAGGLIDEAEYVLSFGDSVKGEGETAPTADEENCASHSAGDQCPACGFGMYGDC